MKTYTICPACHAINGVETERDGARCGACKAALDHFHAGVSELSSAALERLIPAAPLPVLADFWAPWCGPCLAFAPTFLQAAAQAAEHFLFTKVDTQAHPRAGERFQIQAIPTLVLFHKGKERDRVSGALSLPQLMDWARRAAR